MQKTPKAAPDRLNPQALTAEEAQGLIRLAVKDALMYGQSRRELDRRVLRIIQNAMGRITIPSLKSAVYRSLVAFYNRQRQLAAEIPQRSLFLFLCLTKLVERHLPKERQSPYTAKISLSVARNTVKDNAPDYILERDDEVDSLGLWAQKYHRDYYRENILPTFQNMASEEALDPDSEKYWEKKSTLRNRAEREVRYQGHQDTLNDFRARGVRLVIVSAHSDCSERCRPWQGRVYSLDGASGVTSDGRRYIPLETATDIWTENGKWKNGLFGFNCRHYMVEYKDGYAFPMASRAKEEREYKITQKQRYMERQVRHWRTEAEMAKDVNRERYDYSIGKAKGYERRYIRFSREHKRPYYDTRTRII